MRCICRSEFKLRVIKYVKKKKKILQDPNVKLFFSYVYENLGFNSLSKSFIMYCGSELGSRVVTVNYFAISKKASTEN